MNQISTAFTKTTLTEALESQLGDPKNPDNPLSFAYSQKIDETEQFPEEAIRWLYDSQLARMMKRQGRCALPIRRGITCLAYSERDHGADLAASDTVARRTADGFEITGEKWPINRATVGGLCFVLATTDPSAGPRGLSLFMLDKSELDPKRYSNFPKIPTHGMRGSDISGIKFEQCPVPARSLLGGEGEGLQLALRGDLRTSSCKARSR